MLSCLVLFFRITFVHTCIRKPNFRGWGCSSSGVECLSSMCGPWGSPLKEGKRRSIAQAWGTFLLSQYLSGRRIATFRLHSKTVQKKQQDGSAGPFLAAKRDNLSSIPEILMLEGEN